MRELRIAAAGHPAPFRLGAPAYLAGLGGWVAAAAWLLASAPELTGLATWARGPIAVAHARPAVGLAAANVVAGFVLGAIAFADGGPEPLGIPFERLLLVHLSLAVVGWLTVMILAVGRTLVPMLAAAAAAPPRRLPLPELVLVAGLWAYAAGVTASVDALVGLGIVVMAGALVAPARLFLRSAFAGRIGAREGPAAHVVVGLAFVAEAVVVAVASLAGAGSGRRAAVACVLLVAIGWATGVILGHLGKLVALSGWGSWPPDPRPKQADLYPRRGWQLEVALFAVGVELAALGVLVDSAATTRAGGALLLAAATVALGCGVESVRRVLVGRTRPVSA